MTTDQLATTLPPDQADAMAQRLFTAMRDRVPVAPLTDEAPGMTMADGYVVQQGFVRRLLDDGDGVVGYKLGLTSVAMQQMLGIDRPDFAPVLTSHVNRGDVDVDISTFIQPKMEAEIALMLGAPLAGPDCTAEDVRAAVTGAVAALEIVDSRIADWQIKLPDTVADLASCGAIVLSETVVPVDFDLRLVGMVFHRDGTMVATGAGAAALGDPAAAVAWLVNTLHPLGATLEAGHVVMTGALHAAVPAEAGQHFVAEFDRLGTVSARMV